MDPEQMVEAHIQSGAGVTVAAIRVPREEPSRFGVIVPARNDRIAKFQENRTTPPGCRARPGLRLDGQLRVQHAHAD